MAEYIRSIDVRIEVDTNKQTKLFSAQVSTRSEALGLVNEAFDYFSVGTITLDDAPTTTVVQVGHPDNGSTATKREDGRWYNNMTNRPMDLDPRDVTDILYLGRG